jgi:hypothetical protein
MPWYRTVLPENELRILQTREDAGQTYRSAFHYLRTGVPQAIFTELGSRENSNIGVVLKQDRARMVLWRDNGYCGVSDHIFKRDYASREEFAKALAENSYVSCSERDVATKIDQKYKKNYDEAIAERIPKSEREDYASLAWTEGVFRYKFTDIDSVVINPSNLDSCKKGYAFSKVLEARLGRKVDFVTLDKDGKGVHAVDRDAVKSTALGTQANRREVEALIDSYEKAAKAPPASTHATTGAAAFGRSSTRGGASAGGGGRK